MLIGLAGIVVLGISAQWIAWRIRVPAILLLLIMGLTVGPGWAAVTGHKLLDPDQLLGQLLFPIISLSVALILFEGGLTLNFAELRQSGQTIWRLVTIGAVVSWLVASCAAYGILRLPWSLSVLLGAILVVTGPTVITPLLRFVRPIGGVGSVLKWEGIVIDPIGATLALLVFEVISNGGGVAGVTSVVLLRTGLFGTIIGLAAAGILVISLRRFWISDQLQVPLTSMLVIAAYVGANLVQRESGLMAVTVMGIALANQRLVPVGHILEFKEILTALLIGALFILLGSRLQASQIQAIGWRTVAFIFVMILIARPLSVWLSTIGTGMPWNQRIFLMCMAPRGIVAAAVSSVFALRLRPQGIEGMSQLVPTTFAVIVATVCVYGLCAPWLARRLNLSNPGKRGFLIAGANPVARAIALALKEAGQDVLMVDTNRDNIIAARMAGLPTYQSNILSEQLLRRIDGTGIGRLLALTPNAEVNTLAVMHFGRHFGRSQIFQLPLAPDGAGVEARVKADVTHELHGRRLFDAHMTYDRLATLLARPNAIKRTHLTKEFTWDNLHSRSAGSMPMFAIDPTGPLHISTLANPVLPKPGQTVVYLAGAEEPAAATPVAAS